MATPHRKIPSYNIPPGSTIFLDGTPHVILGNPIPDRMVFTHARSGQPFTCELPDGEVGLPTDAAFDELLLQGRARIELPASVSASRRIAAQAHWDARDLDMIDRDARKRLRVCELMDEHRVKHGTKAVRTALGRHWTAALEKEFGATPNPTTVKRWLAERGSTGHRRMHQMPAMNGRAPREDGAPDVVVQLKWKHAMRHFADRRTMKSHHDELAAEVGQVNEGRHAEHARPNVQYAVPCYDTLRRACRQLENGENLRSRHGKAFHKANMLGGGEPLVASRALELVIVDHTELRIMVLDADREIVLGRPWITVVLDVHSRALIGWLITFWPPSYWSVSEAICRSVMPKRPPPMEAARYPGLRRLCGRAATYVVDNGPDFISQSFEDASKGAGFAVRYCPIKSPTYRAVGERAIGTIERRLVEDAKGKVMPIEYSRLADYDPQAEAMLTMAMLEALMNKVAAEYNTEQHAGLGGRPPALVFEKSAARHGIDVMDDMDRFRIDMMAVKDDVQLTSKGLRLFSGLRYHCAINVPKLLDDNMPHEAKRPERKNGTVHTRVKYCPADISVVWVWSKSERRYHPLKCSEPSYTAGMPLWFHDQIRDAAKAEGDAFNSETERQKARARRVAAIRAISPKAKAAERDLLARMADIPRNRQVTGNLVDLDYDFAEAVTCDDFIAHDVASLTALDSEILAPRPAPIPKKREDADGARERRRAARSHTPAEPTGVPRAVRKTSRRGRAGE